MAVPVRRRTARDWGLALALGLLTLLVYARAVGGGFIALDDNGYVYDNPHVLAGWTGETLAWLPSAIVVGNWHPLTVATHVTDVALFGVEPAGHHFTNLALHALSTAALFLLLVTATGQTGRALAVAALWSWHPLRVESVAWIAERKDVLSGLWWMLALAAYTRYAQCPGVGRYATVVTLLILGLLSKPMVVTLPLVLLLWDFWPLLRLPHPRQVGWGAFARTCGWLVWEKLPLLGLSAAACGATLAAQYAEAVRPLAGLGLGLRTLNAARSYVDYLGQMIWPLELAVFYPHPAHRIAVYPALAALLALVAVTLAVLFWADRWRYLAVGWLWYLGTLVPVIGWVQVGGAARADRYTYLPMIGVLLAVVWWIGDWVAARPRWYRPVVVATTLMAGLLAAQTVRQIGYWRDSRALFEHTARVTQDNFFALTSWADELAAASQAEQAHQRYQEALAAFPGYDRAVRGDVRLLLAMGRPGEAIDVYRQALRRGLADLAARRHYVSLCLEHGRWDEARQQCQWLLSRDPGDSTALTLFGMLEARTGKPRRATALWQQALAIDPLQGDAALELAWLWSTHPDASLRNGAGALRMTRVLIQGPAAKAWRTWEVHAAALAETGDFRAAETALQQAVLRSAAPGAAGPTGDRTPQSLRQEWEVRRRRFRQGRPFRQDPARSTPSAPPTEADSPEPRSAP